MPDTFEVWEPLTITAVEPGWRGLYVDPEDLTNWHTFRVVGWGVFRAHVFDAETSEPLPQMDHNVLDGVVRTNSVALVPASKFQETLLWFLSPNQPDPEPGQEPTPLPVESK